jgi:hypothetical protein
MAAAVDVSVKPERTGEAAPITPESCSTGRTGARLNQDIEITLSICVNFGQSSGVQFRKRKAMLRMNATTLWKSLDRGHLALANGFSAIVGWASP